MSRRNWSKVQPKSLRDAMELSIEHAKVKHNRSVDTIAELMGEVNKWTFYKWVEKGDLPARRIKPFQHACGIDLVSRWFVVSEGKLVIEIPTGRHCDPADIHVLQESANDMIGALIKFYKDHADVDTALANVNDTLAKMAWHKLNIEKYQQPELPFDEE